MPKSPKKTTIRKVGKTHKPAGSRRGATKTSRTDTKSSLIRRLLGRVSGATVKELAAATDWQDHSIRGFLSGTLKKKFGLAVSSEILNGVRHYKISSTGVGK